MKFNFPILKIITLGLVLITLSFPNISLAQNNNSNWYERLFELGGQNLVSSLFPAVGTINYATSILEDIYLQWAAARENLSRQDDYDQYLNRLNQSITSLEYVHENGWFNSEAEEQEILNQIDRLERLYREVENTKNGLYNSTLTTSRQALRSEIKNNYSCTSFFNFDLSKCALDALTWFFSLIVWLVSWILWLASKILNFSIDLSINKFHNYANMPGVATAWEISRDLANIFFIFILLYIAINTVLGKPGAQKLVVNVIIVALFVNFSAVIPKVVIDASNILALQFYNNMGKENADGTRDISAQIISWDVITGEGFYTKNTNSANPTNLSVADTLIKTIGTLVLMMSLSFVLVTAAVLFLYRTIVLLFVIVISPLAVLGWALPKFNYANEWLDKLVKEAFYAPAFLFLLLIVLKIFEDTNRDTDGLEQIVFFIIMNGLILASITVARQMGAKGAETATAIGGKFRGFFTGAAASAAGGLAVHTLGRGAKILAESERFKNLPANHPILRKLGLTSAIQAPFKATAAARFGSKSSYDERIAKDTERTLEFNDNPEMQAKYIASLSPQAQKAAIKKLSDRQKAIIQDEAEGSIKQTIDNLIFKLSTEEQEKVDKARADAAKQSSEKKDREKAGETFSLMMDMVKGQRRVKKDSSGKDMFSIDKKGKKTPIYEKDAQGKFIRDESNKLIITPENLKKIGEMVKELPASNLKGITELLKESFTEENKAVLETFFENLDAGRFNRMMKAIEGEVKQEEYDRIRMLIERKNEQLANHIKASPYSTLLGYKKSRG